MGGQHRQRWSTNTWHRQIARNVYRQWPRALVVGMETIEGRRALKTLIQTVMFFAVCTMINVHLRVEYAIETVRSLQGEDIEMAWPRYDMRAVADAMETLFLGHVKTYLIFCKKTSALRLLFEIPYKTKNGWERDNIHCCGEDLLARAFQNGFYN